MSAAAKNTLPGATSTAYLLLKECEPLAAESAFSYHCHSCAECCRNKRIPVFPFDVLRLARFLSLTTAEFIERFLDPEQSMLKLKDSGGCVFLDNDHCEVYIVRPLVCRLYPLQRQKSRSCGEIYAILEPEPKAAGRFGTAGSVRDFLEQQDVKGLLFHLDRYLEQLRLFPNPSDRYWLDVDRVFSSYSCKIPSSLLEDWEKVMEVYYCAVANTPPPYERAPSPGPKSLDQQRT
jgi:Fe-S-cluster containining protein